MKKFFTLFFIGLATFLPAWPAAAVQSYVTVVVYGDSLISGYELQPEQAFAARLDRKLRETGYTNVKVISLSVPSGATEAALEKVDSVSSLHPDIVVLEFGFNDAVRGIRVENINYNLGAIMARLMGVHSTIVLLGVKAPPNMTYQYAQQLEGMYNGLTRQYGAYLYPDLLSPIYGRQELNLADGIHPNAQGMEKVVEYVYPLIESVVRWKWQSISAQQEYDEKMQQLQLQAQPNY